MSSLFNLDNIIGKVKAYLENRINLIKMEAREEIGKVIAGLLPVLVLIILGIFAILFFSLAISFLISYYYEIPWLGFACMALFYIILFLTFYFVKNSSKFKNKINEQISRQLK